MHEYKMLPTERRKDAYAIQSRKAKPTIAPMIQKTFFRVMDLSEDKMKMNLCVDVLNLVDGKITVQEVDTNRIRFSVKVGDIVAFERGDVSFSNPTITHRLHQRHQHPKNLVFPEEQASL
jgi:hypothetical protein